MGRGGKIGRGTWETRPGGLQAEVNAGGESMTLGWPEAGVGPAHTSEEAGKERGAKGPEERKCRVRGGEDRLDDNPTREKPGGKGRLRETAPAPSLPEKLSQLRAKLGQRAQQEPKLRFYALSDRIDRRRDRWEAAGERVRAWTF
jgi:hypothetical protein